MSRSRAARLGRAALALAALLGGCAREHPEITVLDDARTARIGVMTGTTGEAIARARFPDADVRTFDDVMDAIAAMRAGQLDVTVTGFPAALQVAKSNSDVKVLEEPLEHESTSIALRLTDTALLRSLNLIIDSLRADGTLADLSRRWFKDDLEPYDDPDIPDPSTDVVLRVGVAATREPFSYMDRTGRVTGHDGELARRIGVALGRRIEFVDMKFMALIPALQSGKIDAIITGMTATPERAEKVAFTTSYFANRQVMMVRRAAPGRAAPLRAATDLATQRVGVMTGSAHEVWVIREWPQAQAVQYRGTADVALAVRTGKVDGALFDALPLRELLAGDSSLAILGDPLFTFPLGAGFAERNGALRAEFNRFLAAIRANGTYDEMLARWVDGGGTAVPPIAVERRGPPLVVGVSDVGLPFVGLRDGALVGFDIELARRFAASLGRELRVSNMDFGALIAAVASGKVDVIIASIFITAEREEQIDFSDPYFEMATEVFVRRDRLVGARTSVSDDAARGGFVSRLRTSVESNLIREGRWRLLVDGLGVTVVISLLSTLVGTALGALVCAMRMSARWWAVVPAKVYIAVLRGTPVLVMLMLVFYVVFASVDISPVLVAVIAFGMNFAAYVAEIFRSGVEGIDDGQREAGLAMGFSRVQTFAYIILPQTVRRIIPVYKGEFISLVKMTSIVGYIAVQDLTKASDIIRSRTFDAFFPLVLIAVLYFGIAWVLGQAIDLVERRTDPKGRRAAAGRRA